MIDLIDSGFCIIDLAFDDRQQAVDYRFLDVNRAFERQTGLVCVVGQWIRAIVPDLEQYWFDLYGSVALTGEPVRFERPARALQERWYDVYAFRVGEPQERQVGVLFTDISERKRADENLAKAYVEMEQLSTDLQRSNEDLQQFAQMAGHDLRAPVRSMVQLSQLILHRRRDALDELTRQHLGEIIDCGKRMAQMLEDLLRYASVSKEPLKPSVPTVAAAACSQAVAALRVTVEENNATVKSELGENVRVGVELSLLTLVLQNLIDNAIRYRREDVAPVIRVFAEADDRFWRFGVQDNGEGMDMQFAKQVFEPFRRLHGHERPGSGIGLATCERILQRRGGRIWVESQVSQGSTFYFTLPQA